MVWRKLWPIWVPLCLSVLTFLWIGCTLREPGSVRSANLAPATTSAVGILPIACAAFLFTLGARGVRWSYMEL